MTNYRKTNEIIDGYRMDNGEINVDYFVDNVNMVCENTEALYYDARSNRRPLSVAKNWICCFINTMLKYHGYNGYVCTYSQIRNALGTQLETVENGIVEYIKALRNEE